MAAEVIYHWIWRLVPFGRLRTLEVNLAMSVRLAGVQDYF